MTIRLALLVMLFGCVDHDDGGSVPILLASDGPPAVVGSYEHGEVVLDPRFAASFAEPIELDAQSIPISLAVANGTDLAAFDAAGVALVKAPIASDDTLQLVVTAGTETVDALLLVAGDRTQTYITTALAACSWQYSTNAFRGTCATTSARLTLEYWKRWSCSCAGCWERYGEATWCEPTQH